MFYFELSESIVFVWCLRCTYCIDVATKINKLQIGRYLHAAEALQHGIADVEATTKLRIIHILSCGAVI